MAHTEDLVAVLHAIGDPVRLGIVRQLADSATGEVSCGQVDVPVARSTASYHFRVLVSAGVMAEREDGRRKYLRLRRSELDEQFPGLLDAVLR